MVKKEARKGNEIRSQKNLELRNEPTSGKIGEEKLPERGERLEMIPVEEKNFKWVI